MASVSKNEMQATISKILQETPITDVHTHIYPASFWQDPAVGRR